MSQQPAPSPPHPRRPLFTWRGIPGLGHLLALIALILILYGILTRGFSLELVILLLIDAAILV